MFDKAKRYLHKIQLKNKQKVIDELYAKEGLTDEVLNLQVEVNEKRNAFNIPDDSEKIYEDFVQ